MATADGVEVGRIAAPKPLTRAQSRLRAAQRQAARRCGPYDPDTQTRREPSKRWLRATSRVRRIHARVAAIRAQEIHHATTALATRHNVVAVEQLSAKNMSRHGGRRKRGLNRALGDAAIGRIRTQLGYKTTWCGTTLVTAPGSSRPLNCVRAAGRKPNSACATASTTAATDARRSTGTSTRRSTSPASATPVVGEQGPVPAVGRPPASRLEMDVEPSTNQPHHHPGCGGDGRRR